VSDGDDSIVVEEIYTADQSTEYELPLAEVSVQAGFPSPAEDYIEDRIDLNEYLIDNPAATFFVRVRGDSMIEAGVHDGDLLVVDRAKEATDGSVVIAVLDGNLNVKRLKKDDGTVYLMAENDEYEDFEVSEHQNFEVWGVVTNVVHPL
jgi:DNA polymerase V